MLDSRSGSEAVADQARSALDDIVEAIGHYLESEGSLWRIGDLLLKLCGPPSEDGAHDGSHKLMGDIISKIVDRYGDRACIFGLTYLRRLRSTAHAFPRATRVAGAAWAVHWAARDPETLHSAQKEAVRLGVDLSVKFVKDFVRSREGKPTGKWITIAEEARRSATDLAERTTWLAQNLDLNELTPADLTTLSNKLADVNERVESAFMALEEITYLLHPDLQEAA